MKNMKRILLKLSGEALSGEKGFGFDEATCLEVGRQVKEITDKGTQVAIVIGGRQFLAGTEQQQDHRADKIRSDRYARNCDELHLCFRGFPHTGHGDRGIYAVCLRCFHGVVFKG